MPDAPETPDWLKSLFAALRDFFEWSQPAVKPLLWIAAIALALLLLYHFVPAFARWVDSLPFFRARKEGRSEENTSELQSLMRISYAVFCLKNKTKQQ